MATPPEILPKRSWEAALGYMGFWLGMDDLSFLDTHREFARVNVASRLGILVRDGAFPNAPVLDEAEWEALRYYYVQSAPEEALPQAPKPPLNWQLPRFDVLETTYPLTPAVTTLARIREEAQQIFLGDSAAGTLTILSGDGRIVLNPTRAPRAITPVDIEFVGDFAFEPHTNGQVMRGRWTSCCPRSSGGARLPPSWRTAAREPGTMARKDATYRAETVSQTFDSAAAAHHRGDRATAKRLYRKVLKLQPNHYRALRLSALLAHESHDLDEAERFLSAAVRHSPDDDSGALEDLGLLYLQTGRQEKAETVLRRAVERQPESLAALSRLGSTLLTCGRGSEAAEIFERADRIESGDPQVRYGLAHALLESKRFEDAIAASDRALEINNDDAQTLTIKGVALRELGRLEEAETALERSVAIEAKDMNALLHLGRVRLLREDSAGAIDAFERAAALAPELATIHSQLANAHAATGAPAKAVAICDEFLTHNPTSAALLLVKSLALRDAGRAQEADELLGQDTLIRERRIKPPSRYGTIGRFNEALEAMIRGHPSLARTHTNRATRHGIQTGSLSIDPPPEMKTFLSLIDGEIRAVVEELRAEGHGDHPWVRYAPSRWATNSWAVILNDQGYQLSHIHPEAWMSAVYYVAVPEDGVGPGHGEDGWIEFGQVSEQLYAKAAPPLRSIQPEPGLLVMFPSFSFHRTKPFTSAGQRISISFDVFARP